MNKERELLEQQGEEEVIDDCPGVITARAMIKNLFPKLTIRRITQEEFMANVRYPTGTIQAALIDGIITEYKWPRLFRGAIPSVGFNRVDLFYFKVTGRK